MVEQSYFIRANVFGKIKYWESINGLHSGKGKTRGYDIYDSIEKANEVRKRLKKLFHKGIEFTVLPEFEIPFIKKQRKNK